MTLFRANDRTLYFAHIPKTGGTTVSATLREAGAAQGFHFRRRIGGLRCPPQHMHADLFATFLSPRFYDESMTVVRNPYDRIASEYGYRAKLNGLRTPFTTWVDEVLATFDLNPFVMDNHIRHQTEFVQDDMMVFRFEDGIEHATRHACAVLGLEPAPIGHHKRGFAAPLNASPATIDLIREFYAADFAAFDYDPEVVPERLSG